MPRTARARDSGILHLAATFMASFPPPVASTQERRLASLARVCEDGALSLRMEPDGERLVVRAHGDLDIASAKLLEDELHWAIDSEASAVVLDLAGLMFVDSTGLRALLLAAKRSQGSRLRFSMVRAPEVLQNLIKTTGVRGLLPLAD